MTVEGSSPKFILETKWRWLRTKPHIYVWRYA